MVRLGPIGSRYVHTCAWHTRHKKPDEAERGRPQHKPRRWCGLGRNVRLPPALLSRFFGGVAGNIR